MDKPLRVQIRLKNNRILSAIEALGFANPLQAATAIGVDVHRLYEYINFKVPPTRVIASRYSTCVRRGCDARMRATQYECAAHKGGPSDHLDRDWAVSAVRLAEGLAVSAEYLWPDEVRNVRGVQMVTSTMTFTEAEALSGLQSAELVGDVNDALLRLPARSARIVRAWFGIGCEEQTLDQIAASEGVSRERIRQIANASIRILRHPLHSRRLVEHV